MTKKNAPNANRKKPASFDLDSKQFHDHCGKQETPPDRLLKLLGEKIEFGITTDGRYYVFGYEYLVVGTDRQALLSLYTFAAVSYCAYEVRWSFGTLPFPFNPDTDVPVFPIADSLLYRKMVEATRSAVENGAQLWFHEQYPTGFYRAGDKKAA